MTQTPDWQICNLDFLPVKIRSGLSLYWKRLPSTEACMDRHILRKSIWEHLHSSLAISPPPPLDFLDLNQIPKPPKGCLSLSHCPGGALFMHSEIERPIGVDIELCSRISPKIIKRISEPQEHTGVFNDQWIFSAKEATWKSLVFLDQPKTITDLKVVHIEASKHLISHPISPKVGHKLSSWSCFTMRKGDQILDGQGYFTFLGPFILSFFIGNSTFSQIGRR